MNLSYTTRTIGNTMLEDTNFNQIHCAEVDDDCKKLDSSRSTSPDDFGSLFAELLADSLIDSNCENMTDLLVESDSNDCEIEGYLMNRREKTQNKNVIKIGSQERILRPKIQPVTIANSDDNENIRSQVNGKTAPWKCNDEPQINISYLEERGKCTNRNALNARLNRMRKKQYISELESKVESLTRENKDMSGQLSIKTRKLEEANKEITYLRSVISNQKGLMSLLGNISNTAGVKLNASLVFTNNNEDELASNKTGKKRRFNDNSYEKECVSVKRTRNGLYMVNNRDKNNIPVVAGKASKQDPLPEEDIDVEVMEPVPSSSSCSTSGGVCLHVANDKVSIELCSYCASSAENSWEVAGDHSYHKQKC